MHWIALLYIIGMVAFCAISKYGSVPWAIQYYVFVHGIISCLAFELSKKSVISGVRRVYKILGFFSLAMTLYFASASLQVRSVDEFLAWIDSPLWSLIIIVIVLILFIGYYYDKRTGNHSN